MRLLLLDTTFLVDAEWDAIGLDWHIADDDDAAVAAITVAELLVGVEMARGQRRRTRQAFVDDMLASVPIITYDVGVARAHATLLAATRRTGRPRGAHDIVIAATAVACGRTVVTADPAGFEGLPGVEVVLHR